MSYPWSTISRRRERMMKSIFMGLLLFLIGSSSADAQTPYFQGKTIRFVVGYPPGSTHDLICGRGSWDLI